MSFTDTEQELYDFAKASMPRFLFGAVEDWIGGFVKVLDLCRVSVIDAYADLTLIMEASGIWLDQHARDRGTYRQGGELDEALRARLRSFEDAVNPAAIVAAATAALEAAGITPTGGYPGLVETKRDGAHFYPSDATFPSNKYYFGRGARMSSIRGEIVVILPYGTDEATRKSVHEAVRLKKAGGFKHVTERRLVP